jgi:RNA polymerase sigma factor (TIGR02999 family)
MARSGITRADRRHLDGNEPAAVGSAQHPGRRRESGAGGAAPTDGAASELRPVAGRRAARARPAVDELIATVYRELRQVAHHHLRRERPGHTLNTTALVNETYVKLAAFDQIVWRDRAHFLSIAAQAMRRVLVDYAIARKAQKRGGAGQRLSLDSVDLQLDPRLHEVLAVDTALTRLEALNARLVRVVECRFFAGMNIDETAGALDLSPATVKRDWGVARAWLNRELR